MRTAFANDTFIGVSFCHIMTEDLFHTPDEVGVITFLQPINPSVLTWTSRMKAELCHIFD